MLQDLRLGIRMLVHHKGWTIVVVLLLSLGIGANTANFSGVNAVLLKKIPVKDPDTLVRLRAAGKNEMGNDFNEYGNSAQVNGERIRTTFPYAIFQEFQKANQTMTDLFAAAPLGQLNVVVDDRAEISRGYVVSGNFYNLLGVSAMLGRTIQPEDDQPSATPVAVLSEGYWKNRFGGKPEIIDKTVRINNTLMTIVGVVPSTFTGVQGAMNTGPAITMPLSTVPLLTDNAQRLSSPTSWWLQIAGRMKPGVSAQQVQGNLDGVFQQAAKTNWTTYLGGLKEEERSSSRYQGRNAVPHLIVDSAAHGTYDIDNGTLRAMTLLSGIVVLLLLLVCANVANLLLSRAANRQKEISIRLSMGATRARLIRQLLTESVLLSLIGGLGGVVVGYWGRQLIPEIGADIKFDWQLFVFVSALTLLCGIVFGLAPALRATRMNIGSTLKESSRSVVGSRTVLSRALLVVQVAISLVLMIGAGLFLATVQNLRNVNVGFNTSNLVLFRVDPRLNRYDPAKIATLYSQMTERLGSIPGVRSVSYSQPAMLAGSESSTNIFVDGHSYAPKQVDEIYQVTISPGFFKTLEIPLLTGRVLTDQDDAKSQRVAVINETASKKYFPNENPVGMHFGTQLETRGQIEIIGVVRDVKYNQLREGAPPTAYFPVSQRNFPAVTFEVRTATDPSGSLASVRETIRQVDPNLPLTNVTTQAESVEARLQQERFFAQACALFGSLALLLASIGLFGLMSYNVARRTNEIGIRMALGARGVDVLGLVMRESMLLVGVGVAIGIVASVAAGRFIASMMFGLAPTDPLTIAFAIAVMIVVSALAGYLPARRASRVDPMVALHYD